MKGDNRSKSNQRGDQTHTNLSPVQRHMGSLPLHRPLGQVVMSLGEGIMDRKEIVMICMDSPLYFTMPVRMRLELVKKGERFCPCNGLREDLLTWVRTGHFDFSDPIFFL